MSKDYSKSLIDRAFDVGLYVVAPVFSVTILYGSYQCKKFFETHYAKEYAAANSTPGSISDLWIAFATAGVLMVARDPCYWLFHLMLAPLMKKDPDPAKYKVVMDKSCQKAYDALFYAVLGAGRYSVMKDTGYMPRSLGGTVDGRWINVWKTFPVVTDPWIKTFFLMGLGRFIFSTLELCQ